MSIKSAGNVDVALFSGDGEVGKLHVETGCQEEVEILIRFALDASSIVEVESVVAGDDRHEVKFRTDWPGGENWEEMRSLEEWMAKADAAERLLDETKNSLDATLFSVGAQLRDKAEYLSPSEKDSAEKLVLETQNWRDDNEFERLPVSEFEAKLRELRAVVSLIEARDRKHCDATQMAQALTKQLTAVDRALRQDHIHANDNEWNKIQQQVAVLKDALDSVAARAKYDDSPLDLEAIAEAINDAAAKQTALMAKPRPIRTKNNIRRCGPIRNETEEEGDPWCPWQRRQSSMREAELQRQAEMKRREEEQPQRRSAMRGDPWGMPTRRRLRAADPWGYGGNNGWF
jgi:hypothetical protein